MSIFGKTTETKKNATKTPREESADEKRLKKASKKKDKKGAVRNSATKNGFTKSSTKKDIDSTYSVKKEKVKKSNNKQDSKGAIKVEQRFHFDSSEPSLPWGRYVLAVAAILIAIFITQTLPWSQWMDLSSKKIQAALQSKQRPISSVQVEGDFEYISREQLQKLLLQRVSGDFVDIDIKTIQKELAANEWVYSVAVSRIWPDALKVKIIEQQPIALWGNRGFLNRFGEVIITDKVDVIEHLPSLDGDIQKSDEVTQQYLNITQLLAKEPLIVTSLSINDNGSWKVQLDKQFDVFVGQDSMMQKLDNFLYVYDKQLKEKKDYIKLVDLRYESGMAVKWISDDVQSVLSQQKQVETEDFLSSINSRANMR